MCFLQGYVCPQHMTFQFKLWTGKSRKQGFPCVWLLKHKEDHGVSHVYHMYITCAFEARCPQKLAGISLPVGRPAHAVTPQVRLEEIWGILGLTW